jgi:Na+-driven multidrug efflux pump
MNAMEPGSDGAVLGAGGGLAGAIPAAINSAGEGRHSVARGQKTHAREALLTAPIPATLLKLGWPIVAVLVLQTVVGLAEAYYVSYLGTDALAGVTLVFPIIMLVTAMSNGGIGGGVAAAVARAIGAGRRHDADALLLHALVLAAGFGLLFTAGVIGLGPLLYRALGGSGAVLSAALTYSFYTFAGSVPLWIVSLLAAALRGAGNVRVPAILSMAGAAITVALSPALIFGFGPVPRLGIAGAGVAFTSFYVIGTIALLYYVTAGRSILVLKAVHPISSLNPIKIVFHEWFAIWRDIGRARSWPERLRQAFGRPGATLAGPAAHFSTTVPRKGK